MRGASRPQSIVGLASMMVGFSLVLPCAAEDAPPSHRDGEEERGERVVDRPHPPARPVPVTEPLVEGDERSVPDYDGRGEESTSVGDVALWIPRVLLSPLYFVSEFVVRRPLGWFVTLAEERRWPALLIDFFTFGPDRQAGIIPTGLIDFGLRPSAGLYFFWNDAVAKGNDVRLRAAWGGESWLMLNAIDRLEVFDEQTVALFGRFETRPDQVFYGLGPESDADDIGRYGRRQSDVGLVYEVRLPRSSRFLSRMGLQHTDIDGDRGCCDDPTVDQRVGQGRYPAPPGLDSSYTLAYERLELHLDTRPRRDLDAPHEGSDFMSPPGTGLLLSLRGEHSSDLKTPSGSIPAAHRSWFRYGGTLGGYLDLTGEQRSLGLLLVAEFVDPLVEDSVIPFPELVRLGGPFVMRGGLEGRLVDRSAAAARVEYQWPVWVWLDGAAFYEVGNVFGEHLEGFAPELLRSSFGFGLQSIGTRDNPFELMLAAQTKTFEEGHAVETVRFVFGTRSGF